LKPIVILLSKDKPSYTLQDPKISYNTKRICYFKIFYFNNLTKIILKKFFKTIMQVIIKHEITNYKIIRLRETLIIEKQKKPKK
jgi:hypothetical protein